MEFRCPSRIHGLIVEGHLEVKCKSKRCGASSKQVVLHYFNLKTGELIETKRFADPKSLFIRKAG